MPLDEFEVSLAPGEPPALIVDRHSPPDEAPLQSAPWTLLDLDIAPGYTAALAVPGPADPLTAWHWTPAG